MKVSRGRREEYAEGIDKALRRAARNADLTAAATGTRLVVYEKGQIRRVRPAAKLSSIKRCYETWNAKTFGWKAVVLKERES